MGIGSRIEQLIRARGKRPGTLAREAGVSKNTVYSIIKRDTNKIDFDVLLKICTELDIPVELYTPMFAISRIAGWAAHRMEETITGKRIIRPAYKAIAKERPYVPLADRD